MVIATPATNPPDIMSRFRPVDRQTDMLAPSVDDWLPEGHLARFIGKVIDSMELPGGKPPKPPTPGARSNDQINLTTEDSRFMPASGGGFEQAYDAQAAVDTDSLLVVVNAKRRISSWF